MSGRISLQLKQVFAAEIAPAKQEWIKAVTYQSETTCVFEDCTHLSRPAAKCVKHNRLCKVSPCHVFIAGFSCKDLSRQNVDRAHNTSILGEQSSRGATATTFNAMLGYCDVCFPEILVLENVDALGDDDKPGGNLDILYSQLANRGYDVQPVMVCASEWHLPARRRRLYFLGIKAGAPRFRLSMQSFGVSGMLKRFVNKVELMKGLPPDVYSVLLPNDHPIIEAHLTSLLSKVCEPQKESGWVDTHMQEYVHDGARWGTLRPSEEDMASPWFHLLTDRERDILALKTWSHPEKTLIDVSQGIGRVPSSSWKDAGDGGTQLEIAPCILPGMKLWSTRLHRLVIGYECLMLQGFPVQRSPAPQAPATTQHLMKDLAGNSFSGPVVLAFLAALLFTLDWTEADRSNQSTDDDVDDALEALSLVKKLRK